MKIKLKSSIYNYDEGNISLCPVESYHSEFLFRLFIESRSDLSLISGLDEEQKLNIIYQQFIMEQQQLEVMYPKADFNVVMLNNEPIGRFYVYYGERKVRVLEIALLEKYRRIGIGSKLLITVIEEAGRLGKNLNLQVAWFNAGAYTFYEKLGFKVIDDSYVYKTMEYAKGYNRM